MTVTVPAQRCSQRSGNVAVVEVGNARTPQRFAVEDIAKFLVMLGNTTVEHQVVLAREALLQS